jgi:hypothetical protein
MACAITLCATPKGRWLAARGIPQGFLTPKTIRSLLRLFAASRIPSAGSPSPNGIERLAPQLGSLRHQVAHLLNRARFDFVWPDEIRHAGFLNDVQERQVRVVFLR